MASSLAHVEGRETTLMLAQAVGDFGAVVRSSRVSGRGEKSAGKRWIG
jgi:hypothetical protein